MITYFYIFIFLFDCNVVYPIAIQGIKNLSKMYLKKENIFLPPKPFYALRNVSLDFEYHITAVVGPSGSGKSTLAKVLSGKQESSFGTIMTSSDRNLQTSSSYIDPHFYMKYNNNDNIDMIINKFYKSFSLNSQSELLLNEVMKIINIPLNIPAQNLLESQRKLFEIYMGIYQTQLNGYCIPLLILDEYLDKDMPKVRYKIRDILQQLCQHPNILLQVIIITHSYGVMKDIAEHVIILKRGDVFAVGNPNKIVLPAQLEMLE
jgi:ABC-type glutathione transport system ATPase component